MRAVCVHVGPQENAEINSTYLFELHVGIVKLLCALTGFADGGLTRQEGLAVVCQPGQHLPHILLEHEQGQARGES